MYKIVFDSVRIFILFDANVVALTFYYKNHNYFKHRLLSIFYEFRSEIQTVKLTTFSSPVAGAGQISTINSSAETGNKLNGHLYLFRPAAVKHVQTKVQLPSLL